VKLHRDFGERVAFVSIYVREAHPGERYPHHTSDAQKMRHARDRVAQDPVPWPVAVDTLDGRTHNAYGPLPNSIYLVDRTGRVAFRALWAGQEGLVRARISELLNPPVMQALANLLHALRGPHCALGRRRQEMIAVLTSALHRCAY
jgi:hypothetical protein